MKYIIIFLTIILFSGCIVNSNPHVSFVEGKNLQVGQDINFTKQYHNYYRLTHKSKDTKGNDVYHFFLYERIKNPSFLFYEQKEIKGKCLIYYVVDSKTNIIIDWGFDEDGNPKSCAVTG
jgi:hypothetical protein